MGIYTAFDDPAVDATVGGHMQLLGALCAGALGDNLESLVLSGSFGRGEGSVLRHADGGVEPLRDYDMRVITRGPADPAALAAVKAEFLRRTRLGAGDERFSGERGFSLTLEPITAGQLRAVFMRDRDLRAFDFAAASTVVAGRNVLAELRFPAEQIPPINGLRFLYKKMIGLVGHYPGPGAGGDLRRTLIYECDKALIEIGTALVLLAGAYVPSYGRRAELLRAHYRDWYPELAAELPGLADEIAAATDEKLRPGSRQAPAPDAAFAAARRALLAAHRCYARRLLGVDVAPGSPGARALRRALARAYFRPAAAAWLDQRGLGRLPARAALNRAYHGLLRARYARASGAGGGRALAEAMRAAAGPHIDLFLAAWLALAAANPAGPPDDALLAASAQALGRLPCAGAVSPSAGWSGYGELREQIVRGWHTWDKSR